MMRLVTERLVLREYTEADFDALRMIHGDTEVQALRGGAPLTEQETRDEIWYVLAAQQEEPRRRYQFMIEHRETGQVVGYCRLTVQDVRARSAEIGYFMHRAAWGQGYATEAARELLRLGFDRLHLHRIYTGCLSTNVGSARVMEKLGLRREGHLLEAQWANGVWGDTLLYAILGREWNARQSGDA
jgi:[ribosomal protein S5]-alanine N-acetyltransferase